MRAPLLLSLTAAQLYEPDITPQEPQRRFVVTAGCPSTLDASSKVRLFVAVPSAASYTQRRQWARASWCHEARQLKVMVKFFVGAHAEIDDLRYGDIVRVPSWDGQDNVTAKQLHSMRYFSSLCGDTVRDWSLHTDIKPTHYMRVEDDVYPFVSTIVDELTQKHIRAVPRPFDVEEPFLWALIIQGKPPYPAGSGFVLSADVVRAVAAADAVVWLVKLPVFFVVPRRGAAFVVAAFDPCLVLLLLGSGALPLQHRRRFPSRRRRLCLLQLSRREMRAFGPDVAPGALMRP